MADFRDELNKIRGEELQRIDEENKKKQFDIFTYFKDNVVPLLVKDELDAAMTALRDAAKKNPNNKRIEATKEIGKEAGFAVDKYKYLKGFDDLFVPDIVIDQSKFGWERKHYIKKGILTYYYDDHFIYFISLINAACLPEAKNEIAEVFFEKLREECTKNSIIITKLELEISRIGHRKRYDETLYPTFHSSKLDKLCLDCPYKCRRVERILEEASTNGIFSYSWCYKQLMITYAIDL